MISQQCFFVGGPHDKRSALVGFREFRRGMTVDAAGNLYTVRDGPIAECVEKTQESLEHGVVVLEWKERIEPPRERHAKKPEYCKCSYAIDPKTGRCSRCFKLKPLKRQIRKAFTLVEIFVVLAILAIFVALIAGFVRGLSNDNARRVTTSFSVGEPTSCTVFCEYSLSTVEHDKHLWVLNPYKGGVAHHPDCPCLVVTLAEISE